MSNEFVVKEVIIPHTGYEFDLISGAVRLYNDSMKDLFLSLSPKKFANINLGIIWSIIQDFVQKDIKPDFPLIHSTIDSNPIEYPNELKAILLNALSQQAFMTYREASLYVNEIEQRYARRALAQEIAVISKDIANPATDLEAVCARAQNTFSNVELNSSKEPITQAAIDAGIEVIYSIHESLRTNTSMLGLCTGFNQLDKVTKGLAKDSYNLIAARPGVGKTAFALNIIENISSTIKEDKPIIFFSLEMTKQDIMTRVLCSFGHVSEEQLITGNVSSQSWINITNKLKTLSVSKDDEQQSKERAIGHKFYICDQRDMSATTIFNEARKVAKNHAGISLIVIDYIQLIKQENSKMDVNQAIKESNRILRCMAKELDCPLLVLSQLNRDIERRSNKKPTNADLRDSGALEADANLIMFLSKDSQEKENGIGSNKGVAVEEITLSITKNRKGQSGVQIPLRYDGPCYLFSEIGN